MFPRAFQGIPLSINSDYRVLSVAPRLEAQRIALRNSFQTNVFLECLPRHPEDIVHNLEKDFDTKMAKSNNYHRLLFPSRLILSKRPVSQAANNNFSGASNPCQLGVVHARNAWVSFESRLTENNTTSPSILILSTIDLVQAGLFGSRCFLFPDGTL